MIFPMDLPPLSRLRSQLTLPRKELAEEKDSEDVINQEKAEAEVVGEAKAGKLPDLTYLLKIAGRLCDF